VQDWGETITANDGAVKIAGEDGLLVTGVIGDGADSEWVGGGAYNTGMFFNPKKAVFRAGVVDGNQWDDANVGDASTAMGVKTTASGDVSTAMGQETTASGDGSTAMGDSTTASGVASTAMGTNTTALSFVETVIGFWNTVYSPVSATVWNAADRLFSIGNGTGSGALSDALIILKNGKTTMPSTTGSFTPNVLTTTERNALTATAGMMIYNSTTSKHQGYNGSSWNDLY